MKRDNKEKCIPLHIGFIYILITLLLSYGFMTISRYWQFIPIISFSIIFLFNRLIIGIHKNRKRLPWRFWIPGFIVVGSGSILLYVLIPVVNLPEPSGFHSIGTMYITLTNNAGINKSPDDNPECKKIYAQLWYPARDEPGEKPENYIPESRKYSRLFSRANNISWIPFILNHLERTASNSYLHAEIKDSLSKYPLIIFSHGYRQFYKHNTSIIEELASNGYIVMAVTHPYYSSCTVNSDNKLLINNCPGISHGSESQKNTTDIKSILRSIESSDDINELRGLYKMAYEHLPQDRIHQDMLWLNDMLFTLSELESINSLYLNNCADLNAVGVIGFSFGGGTAGLAAMSDNKVKAGINLDGWQPGHTREDYFNCPFMFIMSEDHKGENDFFMRYSRSLVIDLTIDGTKHTNFNDMAIISGRLGKLTGNTGSINGQYCLSIVKELVVDFFDRFLKGIDSGFFDETLIRYSEIDYRTNDPDQ